MILVDGIFVKEQSVPLSQFADVETGLERWQERILRLQYLILFFFLNFGHQVEIHAIDIATNPNSLIDGEIYDGGRSSSCFVDLLQKPQLAEHE